MSTKNAYEIRLEILKEAQNNTWQRYHNNIEAARLRAWTNHGDNNTDKIGDYMSAIQQPTAEEILAEANKLYKFVDP